MMQTARGSKPSAQGTVAKPTASCLHTQPMLNSAPWLPERAYGFLQCCDSDCPYAPQLSPRYGTGGTPSQIPQATIPSHHPILQSICTTNGISFLSIPLGMHGSETPFPRVRHKVRISPHPIKPDIHSYPGMSVVLFYPLMEGSGIPITLIPFHHIILWNSALIMHHLCPNLVCKH